MYIGNAASPCSGVDGDREVASINSGTVDLTGNGMDLAALDVSGAITNNGSISITSDPRSSPEQSAARDPSASRTPIFCSTRACRPGRPSARAARTHSSSSRRRIPRHDQRVRDRRHDRRGELSLLRNDVQFRRELAHPGGILTLHDTTSNLTAKIR